MLAGSVAGVFWHQQVTEAGCEFAGIDLVVEEFGGFSKIRPQGYAKDYHVQSGGDVRQGS